MLSLPFHRRHLRSTAMLTLLAWALALMAGMVNACQFQAYTPGTHPSGASAHHDSNEWGMHAGHALRVGDGDHDAFGGHEGQSDTGKAGCLKFCDDKSSTVAKAEKAQADLPGILMVASIDWRPTMPIATVPPRRSVERPVSQGPPLFIRFLRLTI